MTLSLPLISEMVQSKMPKDCVGAKWMTPKLTLIRFVFTVGLIFLDFRMPKKNKVIGTRGQGVQVWCPRELTTEHLTKPSLPPYYPLHSHLGLWPFHSCNVPFGDLHLSWVKKAHIDLRLKLKAHSPVVGKGRVTVPRCWLHTTVLGEKV